jgi:hypothetical protein
MSRFHDMPGMNVHDYATEGSTGWQRRIATVRRLYRRKSVLYGTIGLVVFIMIISIAVPVSKNRNSSSSDKSASLTSNGPLIPPPELGSNQLLGNKDDLGAFLITLYDKLALPRDGLTVPNSPQYLALNWVSGREEYTQYDMAQRVQRYALATFYYSTFMVEHEFLSTPTDWSSSENWISDLDECTWEGISCNINKQVISITLEEHALSGSLPVELAFLTALQELDFTSNFIYMEDNLNDVWLHLNQLKVLLMEDNYVVTSEGLPTQFSGLTSLQKLILSYNLLQGTLQPESFMSMSSLQHLEIESNYLSGDIPSTLGKLSNLVYIYARRNIFDFALSDMITPASYPALFSLWLDNNPIRGRIPATIADLKNLASLSITNATLTGPIPTELGMLTGLRRVWLYANSLSGSVPTQLNALTKLEVLEIQENNLIGVMPPNVCQTVQASPYEFRALTADCDSVSCDCCTVCY